MIWFKAPGKNLSIHLIAVWRGDLLEPVKIGCNPSVFLRLSHRQTTDLNDLLMPADPFCKHRAAQVSLSVRRQLKHGSCQALSVKICFSNLQSSLCQSILRPDKPDLPFLMIFDLHWLKRGVITRTFPLCQPVNPILQPSDLMRF